MIIHKKTVIEGCEILGSWVQTTYWLVYQRVLRISRSVLPECVLFVSVGADITVSQSLLTQQGVPVIGLSNGKSYCFSLSLETWWETKEWRRCTTKKRIAEIAATDNTDDDSCFIEYRIDQFYNEYMIKLQRHLSTTLTNYFQYKHQELHSVSLRTLIADKGDSLVQCADFRNCLSTHDAPMSSGPLAVMQGRNLKYDSNI